MFEKFSVCILYQAVLDIPTHLWLSLKQVSTLMPIVKSFSRQGFTEFQQKEVCGNEQFTVRIQIKYFARNKKEIKITWSSLYLY